MSPAFSRLLVHVVFSTKRQEPYLADSPLRSAVHAALAEACRLAGATAQAVGGTSDHVHLLVGTPAELSAADLVRELKRESSGRLKQTRPDLVRFHWQAGYGAFSVSPSKAAVVRRYVRSQPEHHRNLSFRDEFRSLLARHKVPFDEATVWD
jgi:REP element-mobilizing transposase RayT